MGDVEKERLTFADLRRANEERQAYWGGVDNWTLSDWSNAVAGEVGEACNIVKKIRRPELGTTGNSEDVSAYYPKLESEIGDVLIYLDLLAKKAGTTLDVCVSRAFNEKSDALGMPVRLLALRQPDTRMERGGEPANWQLEAAWARAEKMSSDTRIQNMSALREILKAVEEARSKLAPNEYPEDIERDAPSSPTVGELEVSKAIDFMNEMARYFENRPTGGEDMAFWANVTNKRNCEGVATLLSSAQSSIQRAERERDEARLCMKEIAAGSGQSATVARIIIAKNEAEDRADAAEGQVRYAVRSIEEYATVRDILREPLRSLKDFLASLGEKQDAE